MSEETAVQAESFARAGFLGNPSDGYFGKTISFAFDAFRARVALLESAKMRFIESDADDVSYKSPAELVHDIRLYGYYGGIRLLKAAAKRFFDYCAETGRDLPLRNFTATYESDIPRLVGLSGSSAICSAMLKALMRFYGVSIPLAKAAAMCLEAERDELGIACGLQDRVIQMYGGIVYMDFRRELVEETGAGEYERLAPEKLPNLYVAWDTERAGESGKAHSNVRDRFAAGDPVVTGAMKRFAEIASEGREALLAGDADTLHRLVDANFDLRTTIFDITPENKAMVAAARASGASAKFAGSGGAIVGTYADEAQFERLSANLAAIGCKTIKPRIAF